MSFNLRVRSGVLVDLPLLVVVCIWSLLGTLLVSALVVCLSGVCGGALGGYVGVGWVGSCKFRLNSGLLGE